MKIRWNFLVEQAVERAKRKVKVSVKVKVKLKEKLRAGLSLRWRHVEIEVKEREVDEVMKGEGEEVYEVKQGEEAMKGE